MDSPHSTTAKRAEFFFDVQNLFFSAKEAFGIQEPIFDPVKLAKWLASGRGWKLGTILFYTGLPGEREEPDKHLFWKAKLQALRNAGVDVFSPPLSYRYKRYTLPLSQTTCSRTVMIVDHFGNDLPSNSVITVLDHRGSEMCDVSQVKIRHGQEKGVDVRLALDIIKHTLSKSFDVGVVFSQDQDLAVAAVEAKAVAGLQGRTIELFSAFPEGSGNPRGVNGTTWMPIAESDFRRCLDDRPYGKPQGRRR